MADERWRLLLPLLREKDAVAQGEMWTICYEYVFGTLLQIARRFNSEAGAPIPDPELVELVDELTALAFMLAFAEIRDYEPSRIALPVWIVWKGRARMNGIVGAAIAHGLRERGNFHLDGEAEKPSHRRKAEDPSRVGRSPEEIVIQREAEARLTAILGDMPADQARALVEVYVRTPAVKGRIGMVARDMGRSSSAMDSLLRRAVKEFRRRLMSEADDRDEV